MRGKRILTLVLAIVVLAGNSETIKATEAASELEAESNIDATGTENISGDYTYYVNSDGKTCTITKYTGTEENVSVPETLNGYTVTSLKEIPFDSNMYVKSIHIPKTVTTMGTYGSFTASGAKNLENIYVDSENPVYYDEDGILYRQTTSGIILSEFPAGKQILSFRVPANVTYIGMNCFCEMKNLKRVIVPDTVKEIHSGAFMYEQLEICLLNANSDSFSFGIESFYNMCSGTKVIVPNASIVDKVNASIYPAGDSNVEIINLAESTADIQAQYTVPATSFTFSDESVAKNITMSTDGTYALADQYILSPAETTENVTWSCNNTNVATVDSVTGQVKAIATGVCTIVGATDSGKSVTLNVTVYQGVNSIELSCGDLSRNLSDGTQYIALNVSPYNANNRSNITWTSSNESVASVEKDTNYVSGGSYENYALLTFLSPGSTTITATIDDNGTSWTKSFVLTVTKNISNCTVSIPTQTYTGAMLSPAITVKNGSEVLEENKDYTISYSTNLINAGTKIVTIAAKDGSFYSGSVNKAFTISKATYDMSKVAWTNTNFSYNSNNQSVTLTGLPQGVTATYYGNTQKSAGTYTATATLSYDKTNYNAPSQTTYKTTWNIAAVEQNIAFSSSKVSNNIITVPYGTKAFQLGGKAKTTISYSGGNSKIATVDKSGKVTIKGTGYTTITVKANKNTNYKSAVTTLFVYVTPQRETLASLKSNSAASLTVKWNKDTKASGYEIQYARNSKFSGSSTVTVSKNSTYTKTIKKLVKGKKYYVRVRAYKTVTVSGKSAKEYGSWSKVKSCNVKK